MLNEMLDEFDNSLDDELVGVVLKDLTKHASIVDTLREENEMSISDSNGSSSSDY